VVSVATHAHNDDVEAIIVGARHGEFGELTIGRVPRQLAPRVAAPGDHRHRLTDHALR
jgi:hypothetical protein